MLPRSQSGQFFRLFLPGLILVLGLAGCGQSLGTMKLVGMEVPKARDQVAVGTVINLGARESQTASFSGATIDDFRKYVHSLQRAGWKRVSENQDVASMTTVLAKDKASAVANWTPSGGIILNVQVPRSVPPNPKPSPRP